VLTSTNTACGTPKRSPKLTGWLSAPISKPSTRASPCPSRMRLRRRRLNDACAASRPVRGAPRLVSNLATRRPRLFTDAMVVTSPSLQEIATRARSDSTSSFHRGERAMLQEAGFIVGGPRCDQQRRGGRITVAMRELGTATRLWFERRIEFRGPSAILRCVHTFVERRLSRYAYLAEKPTSAQVAESNRDLPVARAWQGRVSPASNRARPPHRA
jgi:hypothetical protein